MTVRQVAKVVFFEEVHGIDPQKVPLTVANQLAAARYLATQQSHHGFGLASPFRHEEYDVFRTGPRRGLDRGHLAFAEMAIQRSRRPGQALRPSASRKDGEVVQLAATHVFAARHRKTAHDPTRIERAAKHRGACLAQRIADVGDLEVESQVRLVSAVLEERLPHVDAPERRRDINPEDVFPDLRPQTFDELEHVLFGAERHLHVQLRDLHHAVRAEVLITEAARDLVLATEITSRSEATTSTSPVGMRGFSAPGRRRATLPSTRTTYSERKSDAFVCACGAWAGLNTTWIAPQRSRRSMKINPPWSRRRATQPYSSSSRPSSDARSEPQ